MAVYYVCLLHYFLIAFYLFLSDVIIHDIGKISTINNNSCKTLYLIYNKIDKKIVNLTFMGSAK